jgi:hypothetical protein
MNRWQSQRRSGVNAADAPRTAAAPPGSCLARRSARDICTLLARAYFAPASKNFAPGNSLRSPFLRVAYFHCLRCPGRASSSDSIARAWPPSGPAAAARALAPLAAARFGLALPSRLGPAARARVAH